MTSLNTIYSNCDFNACNKISQEVEERKIYGDWIIQTNTMLENCNWLAKTWLI